MIKQKRLGGFKNIYVAPLNADGETWGTPVPIPGAKKLDVTLNYDSIAFYADDMQDVNEPLFTNGTGKLTITELANNEYTALFGSANVNGGVLVKANDIVPEVAVLFERSKVDNSGKVLFAVYACKFTPPSMSANTREDKLAEDTLELDFTIRALSDQSIYYKVDTTETGADVTEISAWYTDVQKPATV